MDDSIRFTRLPLTKITENAADSKESPAPAQDPKQMQGGISAAKDSFQPKTEKAAFSVDTARGQVNFGDGTHGKTPPTDSQIQASYRTGLGQSGNTGGKVDPNELVQEVLRESYVQTTEDLKFYADKVKQFNGIRKELRDGATKLNHSDAAAKLDSLTPGGSTNIMETLYKVFRDGIEDTNRDKQHYLNLLEKMDKISTDIARQFPPSSSSSRVHRKPDD